MIIWQYLRLVRIRLNMYDILIFWLAYDNTLFKFYTIFILNYINCLDHIIQISYSTSWKQMDCLIGYLNLQSFTLKIQGALMRVF